MDATEAAVGRDAAAREVAGRMAAAAAAWLDALDPAQRAVASGRTPSPDAEYDAERRRWFYTPTDHGGLPLGDQRAGPAEPGAPAGRHRAVHRRVRHRRHHHRAGQRARPRRGLDRRLGPGTWPRPGDVLPAGVRRARWRRAVGLALRRPPRIAEQPRRTAARWSPPPPASSAPTRRPPRCSAPRRCGRWPVPRTWPATWCRSLDPERAARAILLDRAPADIVGGNRRATIRRRPDDPPPRRYGAGTFTERRLDDRVTQMGDGADARPATAPGDHQRIALTAPRRACRPANWTPGSGNCCARCWPPTRARP